jgi:magnesium-transporting ATPase (P-type)
MALPSNPNGVPISSPIHDAFLRLGVGVHDIWTALSALVVALMHATVRFIGTLLAHPGGAIAGAVFGAAATMLVLLVVRLIRHTPAGHVRKGAHQDKKAEPESKDDLKTLPMEEVEKRLGSSPDGLTGAEAATRLTKYGPNEIVETKTNPLLKFLMYFWGPIPWMIEVAVILSGIVRHWPDFFIILLLLVANAVVGFWEERQAGNAIEALKAKLAINARVRRDGTWSTPPAKELVPGDVIRLRLGDIVPADARLLEGDEVSVDQAALTGESLPATKKSGDAIFSGSIIRRGEIGALVYATGDKT